MIRLTDRELLELIVAQVGKLTIDVNELKDGQKRLEEGQVKLEEGQAKLEGGQRKLEIIIEHDIKPKIEALFDGYKLHTEQLNRIENEVSRHEEVILRKIK